MHVYVCVIPVTSFSPFNNFVEDRRGEIEIHFWLNKTQRRVMNLLECRGWTRAGASVFWSLLSELQGRHIYGLWVESTTKLSKYYEIWVGRLNKSVINVICYHLVFVWNEEQLEEESLRVQQTLFRLLHREFDSQSPGPKMKDFQNLFQESWLCFLRLGSK